MSLVAGFEEGSLDSRGCVSVLSTRESTPMRWYQVSDLLNSSPLEPSMSEERCLDLTTAWSIYYVNLWIQVYL